MRRMFRALLVLFLLAAIAPGCATGGSSVSPSPDSPRILEDPSPDEPAPDRDEYDACGADGSSARVKAGSVSVSVSSYPCEVDRTFKELDDLEGREGRRLGVVWWSKLFLKTRLITRGVFSTIGGFLGMG